MYVRTIHYITVLVDHWILEDEEHGCCCTSMYQTIKEARDAFVIYCLYTIILRVLYISTSVGY